MEESNVLPPKFNPQLPIAHCLSSGYLENNGWVKKKNLEPARWEKGNEFITYDGCNWVFYQAKKVEFVEDLNKDK